MIARPIRLAALLLAALGGCAGPAPAPSGPQLVVLGIAQDGGLPHVGCDAPCCADARRRGRRLHPASLGIWDPRDRSLLLIEATPAIEAQLARLHRHAGVQRGRQPVDAVLISHAHIGHYLGLAQFGREVAATDRLPVHVSPRLATFLRGHGPWRQLLELGQIELRELTPGRPFAPIPGITVEAIPVPHRDEYSDTMAFKIRGPRRCVLFVPDIDRFAPELLARLLDGVDVAYLDGTFYDGRELPGRDRREIPHPPIVTTVEQLGAAAHARPGAFRFVHLNHSNPLLHDAALRDALERRGFRIAAEGETVEL
jgi:pyrroloquinoline quinone biosynthesis protein B